MGSFRSWSRCRSEDVTFRRENTTRRHEYSSSPADGFPPRPHKCGFPDFGWSMWAYGCVDPRWGETHNCTRIPDFSFACCALNRRRRWHSTSGTVGARGHAHRIDLVHRLSHFMVRTLGDDTSGKQGTFRLDASSWRFRLPCCSTVGSSQHLFRNRYTRAAAGVENCAGTKINLLANLERVSYSYGGAHCFGRVVDIR